MKNRPNIDLARGFVTPLQWVAPTSQRVRHRSGTSLWLPLHFMDLARDVPNSLRLGRSGSRKLSTGYWGQSGYATSLHKVAPGHSGYLTPLRSPAPDHARIATKCRAG
ncbi:hypothetical protein F2Q70_00004525 [Brassica cretica]|uniref:Uncharacterized protein n=1 Tax=Brassica cretica TaxID=69181 RepID=A0A8S9IRS4_BRACR|nr:hypothetical protein F2Q70_00004525 [Brassica cretica]KAF3564672.1 hypothetical protein DY000_02016595 [Brassica cretica]